MKFDLDPALLKHLNASLTKPPPAASSSSSSSATAPISGQKDGPTIKDFANTVDPGYGSHLMMGVVGMLFQNERISKEMQEAANFGKNDDEDPFGLDDARLLGDMQRPGSNGDEVQGLLEAFFQGRHIFVMDFVHRASFWKHLRSKSRLLILALCSLGAALSIYPIQPGVGSWYYDKARSVALDEIEQPTLETVQAVLLLAYGGQVYGKVSLEWMYYGMAIRLCYLLKLDVDPDADPDTLRLPWYIKETSRRVWWSSYYVLKYRPFTIPYSDSVKFHSSTVAWNSMKDPDAFPNDSLPPHWKEPSSTNPERYLLILVDIFTDIRKYLSTTATPLSLDTDFRISAAQITIIADLQGRLDAWYLQLPPECKPELTESWFFENMNDSHPPWKLLTVLMFYHGNRLLLNRSGSLGFYKSLRDLEGSVHSYFEKPVASEPKPRDISRSPPADTAEKIEEDERLKVRLMLQRAYHYSRESTEFICATLVGLQKSLPFCKLYPSLLVQPIMQAILFFLLLFWESSPEGPRPDPSYNAKARRLLGIAMKSMKLSVKLVKSWNVFMERFVKLVDVILNQELEGVFEAVTLNERQAVQALNPEGGGGVDGLSVGGSSLGFGMSSRSSSMSSLSGGSAGGVTEKVSPLINERVNTWNRNVTPILELFQEMSLSKGSDSNSNRAGSSSEGGKLRNASFGEGGRQGGRAGNEFFGGFDGGALNGHSKETTLEGVVAASVGDSASAPLTPPVFESAL
ncbi:hypothetical protein HDV05_000705, partial [Chytridiales sp. JEL 0842]